MVGGGGGGGGGSGDHKQHSGLVLFEAVKGMEFNASLFVCLFLCEEVTGQD
jgi:hypothetical protein